MDNTQYTVTHDMLCKKAAHRLKRNCTAILIDPRNIITIEIPDVIGWTSNGDSTVIECKTSKSDFQRDKNKLCRKSSILGMGNYRVYLCPNNLLKIDDIADPWGLWWLYESGRIVEQKRPRRIDVPSKREELQLALWAFRTAARNYGVYGKWPTQQ